MELWQYVVIAILGIGTIVALMDIGIIYRKRK